MKTILIGLTALVLGATGLLAADPLGGDTDPEPPILTIEPASSSTTSSTTTTTTTGTRGDVSGPCDEPEHANDPRCTGGAATTVPARGRDVREPGEDVRGPCDEPEHANDPRCTGAGGGDDRSGPGGGGDDRDDDRSGPGRGGDDRGDDSDDRDDDRSGSNSGPG
jgi:hypothetical protein